MGASSALVVTRSRCYEYSKQFALFEITVIFVHPASGSSRYAVELNLPGVGSWPLRRFPHLVFYVETKDCIDVWRVLHGARDIPTWLHEQRHE
jgi:toxin ParE1/3/4